MLSVLEQPAVVNQQIIIGSNRSEISPRPNVERSLVVRYQKGGHGDRIERPTVLDWFRLHALPFILKPSLVGYWHEFGQLTQLFLGAAGSAPPDSVWRTHSCVPCRGSSRHHARVRTSAAWRRTYRNASSGRGLDSAGRRKDLSF